MNNEELYTSCACICRSADYPIMMMEFFFLSIQVLHYSMNDCCYGVLPALFRCKFFNLPSFAITLLI